MNNTDALDKAIACFESQRVMAALLDVEPMTVTQWKKRGVPAERCLEIERATGGVVKCHELRPDVFPAPEKTAA